MSSYTQLHQKIVQNRSAVTECYGLQHIEESKSVVSAIDILQRLGVDSETLMVNQTQVKQQLQAVNDKLMQRSRQNQPSKVDALTASQLYARITPQLQSANDGYIPQMLKYLGYKLPTLPSFVKPNWDKVHSDLQAYVTLFADAKTSCNEDFKAKKAGNCNSATHRF